MTHVILVEGTFGGEWARAHSPFRRVLFDADFASVRFQGWSTDVDGVPNILEAGHHREWIAGGFALGYFLRDMPLEDRNILCHSHGINPVLYACGQRNITIRNLVSVCSPVRQDMQQPANAARPQIGRWLHVASTDWDPWQWAGELFSGSWWPGRIRQWTQADQNRLLPNIGHSKLLNDPAYFGRWQSEGLLDFLKGPAPCSGS